MAAVMVVALSRALPRLAFDRPDRLPVLDDPCMVAFGRRGDARQIAIVAQIGELDPATERNSSCAITEAIYTVLEDAFQVLEAGCVPVELLEAEVAMLIERGILKREERGDRFAVAASLYRILEPAFAGLRDGSLKPAA
jgi:hypothetical protein